MEDINKSNGDDLRLHELNINKGNIDMKLSGESAKMFMFTLVEFFKKNGGKNYLTLTLENKEEKYAITIENCKGKDTPAEKIGRLQDDIFKLVEKGEYLIEAIEGEGLCVELEEPLEDFRKVVQEVDLSE